MHGSSASPHPEFPPDPAPVRDGDQSPTNPTRPPALVFRPWLGRKWGLLGNAFGGIRVLVLGESHYCGSADAIGTCDPDLTSEVVEECALEGRHRFFTNITQVLSGRKKWQLNPGEISDLWDSLVFYNYVPTYVAAGPRVRPSPEMFRQGRQPFAELIADLKPEAILVCGFALWWWVLTDWPGFEGNPAEFDFCRLGPALAARMKHPSAAFSSEVWRPTVITLLQSAQEG